MLLQRPLAEALALLPLSTDSREALLGAHNPLRAVLEVVTAYEAGDWERAEADAAALPWLVCA